MCIASDQHGESTISGPIADQAALHRLLTKVRDLGLPLLSVQRTPPTIDEEEAFCS